MCDTNAKSECILIKLCALVFESICERTTKFHEKILFDSRVINLQAPTTNISISNTFCLLQSLVRKWHCVVRTRSTFFTIRDGVAVRSLGHRFTDLFFIDQGTKVNGQYYRDVLLHQQLLSAIRDLSGDFFSFQQDNAPAHRARETLQLLTCETPDFIAPAPWPANSPDLNPVDYQTWGSIAAGCMTLTS